MRFRRLLDIKKVRGSAFLFGPRMTGKTFLLRDTSPSLYEDLLDPEKELLFKQTPRLFWEELSALKKGSLVVVDEIQRAPVLLDYVQKGMEELGLRFILSGSSARKLKRGGANLLGGRALDLKLHPLTAGEVGDSFDVAHALQYGTLPKITELWLEKRWEELRGYLRSYYTTYIKEEIQAEAATRHVGAFQRFLNVAVQCHGQVVEFANISRECAVPASTVKEYFSILEDTLIGEFLWPWDRSERKKARPKFYFFDNGVVRAIQNRLVDPPTPEERGALFESWFFRELIRLRDYGNKEHDFSFWREGPHEMDILVMKRGRPVLGIECKSGNSRPNAAAFHAFHQRFPGVPLIVSSLEDGHPRRISPYVEILPFMRAIERYAEL